MQQVIDRQTLFLLTADIKYDLAGVHHNEPVAVGNGILHIAGDHQGGEGALRHKAVGKLQETLQRVGNEGSGTLICIIL